MERNALILRYLYYLTTVCTFSFKKLSNMVAQKKRSSLKLRSPHFSKSTFKTRNLKFQKFEFDAKSERKGICCRLSSPFKTWYNGQQQNHSSEINGLCLMKWPSETLHILPYFIYTKTQSCFFHFPFNATLLFPLINALVYVDIDQGIH